MRKSHALTRRDSLALLCSAASRVRAQDATVQLSQADQFVDSVGVCTHLDSEPYVQNSDVVLRMCALLGLRHVRDELRPSNDSKRWHRLRTEAHIQSHLLVSPATNTVAEMIDFIEALDPHAVSAVEGQNEGDSAWFEAQEAARPGWAEVVNDYQRAVFGALRQRPSTRLITVVSPTVLDYVPGDMRRLVPAAPFCDCVGLHAYAQGRQQPETRDDFAAIEWYIRHMRDPFKPRAPVMVTETGYATGKTGISQQAAATYLPRLLLHLFDHGVVRSFLYELMDEGSDDSDPEQCYGILTARAAPKPAFHALRLLLGALADPGSAFAPGRTTLGVERAPADLRLIPFRKRNGEIVIALWRTARVWDPAARRDLEVAPAAVTLKLPPGSTAATLRLAEGSAWATAPLNGGRLTLSLKGIVTLVRIA